MRTATGLLALLIAFPVAAEPIVLRFATPAPDGTLWANEIRTFAKNVETATSGKLHVKVFWGGVVGGDLETRDRVQSGQIDGVLSGGGLCAELSPTMRLATVPGVFQDSEQSEFVMARMKPVIDEEFLKAGFVNLVEGEVGTIIIFSRAPVASMSDFRRYRFWTWDAVKNTQELLRDMRIKTEPLRLDEGALAYREGKVDGFVTVPTAALNFQWFAQVRYFSELPTSVLTGCVLVATRAYDPLPFEMKRTLQSAAAELGVRFTKVTRKTDIQLLNETFEKRGLKKVQVSEVFRAEYFAAAREARERGSERLVPRDTLNRVQLLLADYRAEHYTEPAKR